MNDTDRALLDIEASHWRYAGTKEAAIRAELGLTATRYYQRLAHLVTTAAAHAYAPLVCARVRALLATGARRR